MIHALLIVLAFCVVAGLGLMMYHLRHAPVGEETPEGFDALNPNEGRSAQPPAAARVSTQPAGRL